MADGAVEAAEAADRPDTTAPHEARTVAALDLGTNSFHLVVARVRGTTYEVVTREKETIRLGHGGGDMKVLADDAIERGVSALRRMKRIADSHGATVRAVATSAVREAENADVFIGRARRDAGIEVEVISGIEEARLVALGFGETKPLGENKTAAGRETNRRVEFNILEADLGKKMKKELKEERKEGEMSIPTPDPAPAPAPAEPAPAPK